MNARQKIHQAHLTEWAARFQEQKNSGLTIRQWCEQNSISIHKYNYWKHQVKEELVDQMLPDIVQLPIPDPVLPSGVPDHGISDRSIRANRTYRANYPISNIRLCIDGVALELEPSVSEDFLRTLIRALHYA